VRTPGVGADMPLRLARPEHHVALGLACPCPGREPGLRPHVGTPGTWAACPFTRSDPRATWRYLTLGLPCLGAGAALPCAQG